MVTNMSQFHVVKMNEDECLVFGYANVSVSKSTVAGSGGKEFYDLQKDSIPPEELEKAAYEYLLEAREADEMHRGGAIGQVVESLVFTPDKLVKFATDPVSGEVDEEALAVLKRIFPCRWWVGYKLTKGAFAKVKDGTYKMFSIGGEADREEV